MIYPITIERRVTVALPAEDWELFTSSMNCDRAAFELNVAASEGLSMATPREAYEHWEKASDKWAKYGAADSEPRYVMRDLIKQVFGERY